jgi:hypothetical protein
LALLDYAETGVPPELTTSKMTTLVDRLESALKLQNADAEISHSGVSDDTYVARIGPSSTTFGVRSCLREPRMDSDSFDHDYSDHDLSHQLPGVAHRLIKELE